MHETIRSSRPPLTRLIDFLLARDNETPLLHVAFVLFVACSLFQSLYHTPWRDEAQAWLMARDLNVWGLFLEARHDGHPILWHLCLKVLQSVGINYVGMMVLNSAFISGAVWLLFYQSRLPLLARLFFAFSPACLLQVCYYARDYAVSVFLFFLAATVYRNVQKRPILFASLLGLAANTNLYATAVFAGAAFQFVLEQAQGFGSGSFSLRPIYTRYLAPNLVLVFAAVLIVLQLAPVPHLFEPPRPEIVTAAPTGEATVQGPAWEKFALRVEHASIFKYNPHLWLFLLIFLTLLLFRKRVGPTRIYGAAITWLIALAPIACNPASTRHIFVLLGGAVYFLWIYYDDLVLAADSREEEHRLHPSLNIAGWVTIFIIALSWRCQQEQLNSALVPVGDGPATARAIIDHHLDSPDTILVTTDPNRLTSVLMLLDHIRVDYRPPPFPAKPDSFADFYYYRQRKRAPTVEEMKPLVLDLARANPSKTIVVVSADPQDKPTLGSDPDYPLTPIYATPIYATPIYATPSSLSSQEGMEAYQVYLLQRPRASSP